MKWFIPIGKGYTKGNAYGLQQNVYNDTNMGIVIWGKRYIGEMIDEYNTPFTWTCESAMNPGSTQVNTFT